MDKSKVARFFGPPCIRSDLFFKGVFRATEME